MEGTRTLKAWSLYRKVRVVGAGGFGQVFLVEGPLPQQSDDEDTAPPLKEFVAKRILLDMNNPELVKSAEAEVSVLQKVNGHENILHYEDHFFDDEGCLNIIVEHCPVGDLEQYIMKQPEKRLELADVLFLTLQLLVGVRYLHSHGVIHRDLKPANLFLVCADDDEDESDQKQGSSAESSPPPVEDLFLRIADFGISRIMRTGSFANTVVGTPHYIPPEVCENRPYTEKADMWAVGCLIYEMATGKKMFPGDNMLAIVRAITDAQVPDLVEVGGCSPDTKKMLTPLLNGLIRLNGEERLSADDAINTFFMSQLMEGGQDDDEAEEEEAEAEAAPRPQRDKRELEEPM